MNEQIKAIFKSQLDQIKQDKLLKSERVLTTPQQAHVGVEKQPGKMLNMCANNYLGLAHNPLVQKAAQKAIDDWGFGMASVRFICGTQTLHQQLEKKVRQFVGADDAILYSSCFDANGGLFETLLTAEDAIISDQLNHASIIDGIRLCKAKRFRYANSDMNDLESKLRQAESDGARIKLIATDGVFSMDGYLAKLPEICDLADQYGALVMVDDSHATGFIGKTGRGTPEHFGVQSRIDIITSTFGKALGGATGGFTAGRQVIIDTLRQKSRPYLFSNSLAPSVAGGSLQALKLLEQSTELRDKLEANTKFFRDKLDTLGFNVLPSSHPIVPIMLPDAAVATEFAQRMLTRGVYVIAFTYPVVPKGASRIRTQISAAHSKEDLQFALDQFAAVKEDMELN